jgi:hypothetical protein
MWCGVRSKLSLPLWAQSLQPAVAGAPGRHSFKKEGYNWNTPVVCCSEESFLFDVILAC